MSKKATMIIVEPDDRIRKEVFMTAPTVCPYCNGRGGFSHDTANEPEFVHCPDCEGTGEVVAMVTIDWKPNVK
jgi:DnaJ-class molecular chaperone